MAFDHQNMSGTLLKNSYKRTDETGKQTDPDFQGTALIEGCPVKMNGWLNTSRDGKTRYIRITFHYPKDSPRTLEMKEAPLREEPLPETSSQSIDDLLDL